MSRVVDIRSRMPRHRTKQVTRRQLNAIRYWVLHHSLTTSGSPEAFANYHINTNNWSIMAYHYVVGRDGTIYWCADHDIQTPHVGNSNRHSLGVCMVGDFRTQTPTQAQYEAVLWLFSVHLPNVLAQGTIRGHSEMPGYAWKACPVISMSQFRNDVQSYRSGGNISQEVHVIVGQRTTLKQGDRGTDVRRLQQNLNKLGHNAGVEDGIFGANTARAVRAFQQAERLTVDGIAGPQTLGLIKEKIQAQIPKVPPQTVSSYAEEAVKWASENGISNGERPRDPATRQEVLTMLHRYHNNVS